MRFLPLSLVAVASANTCTLDDVALWKGSQDFANAIRDAAVSSNGSGSNTVKKLVEKYPSLSAPCGSCFADMVNCGRRNCFLSCGMDSTSANCIECSNRNCRGPFKTCSGIENDQDLPLNPKKETAAVAQPAAKPRTRTRQLADSAKTEGEAPFMGIVQIVLGQGFSELSLSEGLPVADDPPVDDSYVFVEAVDAEDETGMEPSAGEETTTTAMPQSSQSDVIV